MGNGQRWGIGRVKKSKGKKDFAHLQTFCAILWNIFVPRIFKTKKITRIT